MGTDVGWLAHVLGELRLELPEALDLESMADRVSWSVTEHRVHHQLSSCTLANDVAEWIAAVKNMCGSLSLKLANPPGNAGFHVTRYMVPALAEGDGPSISLSELGAISAITRDACARAEEHLKRNEILGHPTLAKTPGKSPADYFVLDLADIFQEFLSAPAKVRRINAERDLGGPFVQFVNGVCEHFGADALGPEAIKKALRKRDY